MADGTQNSCASYNSGFDKNGCNKYLPNYPDDYYILNYVSSGGNCDDLKDCKREITPTTGGSCAGVTNKVGPYGFNNVTIENFGVFSTSPLNILLWIGILYLIGKVVLKK